MDREGILPKKFAVDFIHDSTVRHHFFGKLARVP